MDILHRTSLDAACKVKCKIEPTTVGREICFFKKRKKVVPLWNILTFANPQWIPQCFHGIHKKNCSCCIVCPHIYSC